MLSFRVWSCRVWSVELRSVEFGVVKYGAVECELFGSVSLSPTLNALFKF